jgi:hypothetical protein
LRHELTTVTSRLFSPRLAALLISTRNGGRQTVTRSVPLRDYQNGVIRVTFDSPGAGPLIIVIDPEDRIDGITERNNRADVAGESE